MKIKFLGVVLLLLFAVFCNGVFAGAGVSLPLPDFAWPEWAVSLFASVLDYLDVITSFVGFFALLAAATPNKWDNAVARVLRAIVDFVGANFYNAKNERQ